MKRSKLTLMTSILTTMYFILLGAMILISMLAINQTENMDPALRSLSLGIGFIIVMPHGIMILLSTIFAWLGYGNNRPGFVLTQAILLTISAFFWWPTWYLTGAVAIVAYVAYARMSRRQRLSMDSRPILVHLE